LINLLEFLHLSITDNTQVFFYDPPASLVQRADQMQGSSSFNWHVILIRKEQAPDNQNELDPESGNDLRRFNL